VAEIASHAADVEIRDFVSTSLGVGLIERCVLGTLGMTADQEKQSAARYLERELL